MLERLDGVAGGTAPFAGGDPEDKSALLPASRRVRFGEAKALASLRKVARALNELRDAMS